jgi:hypothetical protein
MEDYKDEKKFAKRIIYWFIGLVVVLSVGGFLCTRTVQTIDNGIVHYEEFQEIYNTCTKLNLDLCNMKDLPETDKMFEQFSKTQRVNTIKGQLNRWTEDYNAKSKMFNRSIWKSSALPYELQTNQFNCY